MTARKKNDHFYDDIIEIESVFIALDELDMKPHEKEELSTLVESQVHHTILDLILSHLSARDKQKFMELHAHKKHDAVWELLNDRIDNVEDKIAKTVEDLKKKLHSDIKAAK